MTPREDLLSHLARRIRRDGPIPFAEFMAEALYHPVLGRYSAPAPPMGPEGDYITSPEVDPAFGRLLGRAAAEMAYRCGAGGSDPFTVVEMGPGRGTLCRDLLRGIDEDDSDLAGRIRCVLVETSEARRREQRALLAGEAARGRVAWSSWEELLAAGIGRGCLLANEFLDALPVHVVEWSRGALREVHVTLDDGGALREALLDPSTPELARRFEELGVRLAEGQRAEVNLAALRWVREAAEVLASGYIVIIDYGHEAAELYSERRFAGTLVGYRRHALVLDPLEEPGAGDLTSHVDFTSVAQEARRSGFEAAPLTSQRRLLVALGLAEMVADLSARARAGEGPETIARRFALHALMSPSGMGETFKVLVLAKEAPLDGLACLSDPFRAAAPVAAPAREG
jgi:SAM-dependent MidA family methyltransferase